MRRVIWGTLALALAASALPAGAGHQVGHSTNIEFTAPLPCMVYCAYWLDIANTDLDGDQQEDIFFEPCLAPFPPNSYDDVVVRAPSNARILVFEIFPPLDWDSFICSKPAQGNNGETLATGAIAIGEACDGLIGPSDPTGTGCPEEATVEVVPGRQYVLRAYNWQDTPTIQGRYIFR